MLLSSKTILFLASLFNAVESHGYVKSPRSRNYVASASQDGKSWGGGSTDPEIEYCPHCLNRGGTLGACGVVGGRDYDFPNNALGGAMPTNVQGTYAPGEVIDIDIVLTAHHKGHFAFYACPVTPGQVPTDACFKEHPLEFVEDLLYGATKDSNYPERAYIPPYTYPDIVTEAASVPGTLYQYRMQLPDDIQGDLVLLQWYYLTANSCAPEGYTDYNFPADWPDLGYSNIAQCGVIPADGNGVPEQFWNCVETSIPGDGSVPAPTTPVAPTPVVAPTNAPVTAPTPTVTTTSAPVTTPATSAPVAIPATSSPVSAPSGGGGGPYQVSTSARCGASELDARGNCGATCATINDCASGEWCWGVQANYCDSKPFQNCADLSQANANSRCGANELEARGLCGASCTTSAQCAGGEYCFPTHTNTCDCQNDGSRMLRGDVQN